MKYTVIGLLDPYDAVLHPAVVLEGEHTPFPVEDSDPEPQFTAWWGHVDANDEYQAEDRAHRLFLRQRLDRQGIELDLVPAEQVRPGDLLIGLDEHGTTDKNAHLPEFVADLDELNMDHVLILLGSEQQQRQVPSARLLKVVRAANLAESGPAALDREARG